jgi:molybdate transport system ATP-binding protein
MPNHSENGGPAAPANRPLVTLRDVSLRLGDRVLFPGISWEVRRGEHWAIVGPSGSGKSLLAGALCGQVSSEGTIAYHLAESGLPSHHGWFPRGSVVRVGAEEQQRFALQHGDFYQARWHATEAEAGARVRDLLERQSVEGLNPYEVLPAARDPEAFARRRDQAIRLFGLEPLLDRRAVQLSNGETRKLVLARAVALGPALLVLDDPFAGLDASFRDVLRTALEVLAADGLTLVIVTSRPEELPSCVSRFLLVRDHRTISELSRSEAMGLLPEPAATLPPAVIPELPATAPVAGAAGPLLELRDVTIRYGTTVALDRVSLRVDPGQHWAITGPNGAGKTTLLSLILADHPQAYANQVELFGRRRGTGESIWEIKSRIGWVSPELHAHFPAGTRALEVVGSGFHASVGLFVELDPAQRARARACLDALLPEHADQPLVELSYGMQRLVLIARALVTSPPLLVLDEPCQGLDAAGRVRVLEAIDRAAVSGRTTVLFVSHQTDEIPRAVSHQLELHAGKVVRCGPRRPGTGPPQGVFT